MAPPSKRSKGDIRSWFSSKTSGAASSSGYSSNDDRVPLLEQEGDCEPDEVFVDEEIVADEEIGEKEKNTEEHIDVETLEDSAIENKTNDNGLILDEDFINDPEQERDNSSQQKIDKAIYMDLNSLLEARKIKDAGLLPETDKVQMILQNKFPVHKLATGSSEYRFFEVGKSVLVEKEGRRHLPYMHWSVTDKSITCLACAFYSKRENSFRTGFKNWRFIKAKDRGIKFHLQTKFHLDALCLIEKLHRRVVGKPNQIEKSFNEKASSNRDKNTNIAKAVIESIRTLALQGQSLRGHTENQWDGDTNPGNFIMIMQLLRNYNTDVDSLFSQIEQQRRFGKKVQASLLSPQCQNEIIDIMAMSVQNDIIQEIKKSGQYTLILDECSVRGDQFLSVCCRYVSKPDELTSGKTEKAVVKEEFLTYLEISSTDAQTITDAVVGFLKTKDLPLSMLRGVGTDGASNMSGGDGGVAAKLQKLVDHKITFTHCFSHNLSLAVLDIIKNASIQKTLMYMSDINHFYNDKSPKRTTFLNMLYKLRVPTSKRTNCLVDWSPTRWTQSQSSWYSFYENIFVVYEGCKIISENKIPEDLASVYTEQGKKIPSFCVDDRSRALGFLNNMEDGSFITGVVCIYKFLSPLVIPTKLLQGREPDILSAYNMIQSSIELMEEKRRTLDSDWDEIWTEIQDISKKFKVPEVKIKRRADIQVHRGNMPGSTEEYLKRLVAIDLLDQACTHLRSRFKEDKYNVTNLMSFFPCQFIPQDIRILEKLVEDDIIPVYEKGLPDKRYIMMEMLLAHHKLSSRDNTDIISLIDLYNWCIENGYQDFPELLQLVLTLPITSNEAERSFSCLRRLYTWLRRSMKSQRLSNLGLLHMFRERVGRLTPRKVLEMFNLSPRRMEFNLEFLN